VQRTSRTLRWRRQSFDRVTSATVLQLHSFPKLAGLEPIGGNRTQKDVRIGPTEPPVAGSAADGGGGGDAEALVARRPVMARRPACRRPQRRRRRRRRRCRRGSHVVGHVVLDVVAGDIWRTAAKRVWGATPGERNKHYNFSFEAHCMLV